MWLIKGYVQFTSIYWHSLRSMVVLLSTAVELHVHVHVDQLSVPGVCLVSDDLLVVTATIN